MREKSISRNGSSRGRPLPQIADVDFAAGHKGFDQRTLAQRFIDIGHAFAQLLEGVHHGIAGDSDGAVLAGGFDDGREVLHVLTSAARLEFAARAGVGIFQRSSMRLARPFSTEIFSVHGVLPV